MNFYPVQVFARRDDDLSRGLPLIKWLLLIPHYIVLVGLWLAFAVLTLVAYVAVLVSGRYPRSIHAFNVGVMRWSWRVSYYGYEALGTDRYPPFTLADVADYPARLSVGEPPRPPRWLPLVAWLLAIPHLLIVRALTGAATWQIRNGETTTYVPLGVVSTGILIVAVSLLFTRRYPRGLYDLLVGIARWNIRVTSYVALLTSQYPPFRLDQGEHEPDDDPTGPAGRATVPGDTTATVEPAGTWQTGTVAGTPPPDRTPVGRTPVGRTPVRSAAGPVIALAVGVLLLFAGIGTVVGGGAVLALSGNRDSGGYVTSPAMRVESSTAAITVEDVTIHTDDLWSRNLTDIGGVRITGTDPSGAPLFLGIARASAVDGWLAGTAHDQLLTVSNRTARYDRAAGPVRPVTAPTAETFWLATASGTGSVVLNWRADDGDFAVVLANADGTPGVTGQVRVATQIPDLTGLGGGLLGTGIVLTLLAIVLIVVGGTGLGRRHAGPPQAPLTGPPTAPLSAAVEPPAGPRATVSG
jgi:hypothetical protein